MNRTTTALLLGILLGGLFPTASLAQDEADATVSFGAYEPSPAYPFGRPHPEAPPELEQFAFMIGAFDCVDEIRQQDESWNRFPAVWNARAAGSSGGLPLLRSGLCVFPCLFLGKGDTLCFSGTVMGHG